MFLFENRYEGKKLLVFLVELGRIIRLQGLLFFVEVWEFEKVVE